MKKQSDIYLEKVRYDLQETAKMLSFSVSTILRRIEDGKILGSYMDSKKIFVPASSIIEYLEKRMQESEVYD